MFQELGIPMEVSESWDYSHIGRFEYSCRWDDEWIEHEIDHVLIVRANVDLSINKNVICSNNLRVLVVWNPKNQNNFCV